MKVTISYLKTAAVSAEHCSWTRFILEHRSYVLSPENNQRVCSGHTRQTAFPKNNKWRARPANALLMYPRAKQPAKCKSSYPSELHQMTENTQLCMTWGGGRVGHKDEHTISSCFTNRFSARLHSRSRSLRGKLRQQPAKPTSVFHHVPFSHWPISPLLKDNRTNNWPPPQPLTSNTPLLVRCVGVFQKVHTLLYKSLEPPIISVLNVSCRLCGCTALLVCLGSLPCWSQMDPNQSAPFCHSFCSSFVQLQGHTAQHEEMMALVLV